MYQPNLKSLSPLFLVLVTGCASTTLHERVDYVGSTRVIYEDVKKGDKVVGTSLLSSEFDQEHHDRMVKLEEAKHQKALELANTNARLQRENAVAIAEIEEQKHNKKLATQIFEDIATMEIENPVLDQRRRNLLVDGIIKHIDNQAEQLSLQGATNEERVYHEISELFEMYDVTKSGSDIKNPVVRDAVLQRSINEIVTRYNGGENPQMRDLYRQNIDQQLATRGLEISALESQFKSSIILKPTTDGAIQVFIPN